MRKASQARMRLDMRNSTAIPRSSTCCSKQGRVARSLPLLQKTDAIFFKKSGCVSCHNNTLTAMTVAAARKNGVPVDEQTARAQLTAIASFIDGWRERVLQGIGIPGDPETISHILLGM